MYTVYVLRCLDDSLYTGITTDLIRRIRQHCGMQKGGAKYTKSHPPTALVCAWQTESHHAAARFEIYFKQLTRREKLALIASPEHWQSFLPQVSNDHFASIAPMSLESFFSQSRHEKA